MQYFDKFAHTLLTPNEITSFAVALERIINELFPTGNSYLPLQFNPMLSSVKTIDILSGKVLGNEYTDELFDSDVRRDNLEVALISELTNAERLELIDPARAAIARELLHITKANPVDVRSGYQNESAQLRQQLGALNTPEVRSKCEAGGFHLIIDALSAEQDQFETYFQNKLDAETVKMTGSIREERAIIVDRIDNVLTYVGSNVIDLPNKYLPMGEKISELITATMTPARARKSRKEHTAM